MERRRLQIPSGMQDTLPGECAGKRRLEDKLRRLFTLGGYQEIETPILEYYDALDDQTFGYRPEQVWKTFNPQARILAVRPDSTIPAVRLASGRLKNAPLPLRLCYVQSAAKFHSETLSLLCEDTQAGVELMGEGSAQADAEVIALAVEALRAAGIRDFLIELGQVKFVSGFLEEAGLTAQQCAAVRDMMAHKNALDMQLYLDRLSIEADVSRRLMRLPQLFGDAAVLDEAEQLTQSPKCLRAIAHLRQVLSILQDYGCADCVSIDLGLTQQANYYSGVVFHGLAAELGQPLLSGGRYDGLPAQFGRPMPATGFALSLKLTLMALERQGETFAPPVPDVILSFAPGGLRSAIAYAHQLRDKGVSVALLYGLTAEELHQRVDSGEASAAVYLNGSVFEQYGKAVF